jgi:hypothetical protein
MAKKKATSIKTPARSRSIDEWINGKWHGATQNKLKYSYCKKGPETLDSIAKSLSGKATGNPKLPSYKDSMTWKDITLLNFGTKIPEK